VAAMAHYERGRVPEAEGPEMTELSLRRQVESVFGWKQCSVRILCIGRGLHGVVCYARVQGLGTELDFLFANGCLVGVPPKKRGQY